MARGSQWGRSFDQWWWYNKTEDVLDGKPGHLARVPSLQRIAGPQGTANDHAAASDPRLRRLCCCVEQVDQFSGPVHPATTLHGLDSLQVALLTARVRAEFRLQSLSVAQVRRAATVSELLTVVDAAQEAAQDAISGLSHVSSCSKPCFGYRLWFTPGQYSPMGAWVVRSDAPVDVARLEEARLLLIERHAALRARPFDELRLQSFFLDTAVLFTLGARLLDRCGWLARTIRKACSWAIWHSWPQLRIRTPQEAKAVGKPCKPVTVYGQESLEWTLQTRRNRLNPEGFSSPPLPFDVALVRLETHLVGNWIIGKEGGFGNFQVVHRSALSADGTADGQLTGVGSACGLVYVGREITGEPHTGVLCGPGENGWVPPPWGFPALLSARLTSCAGPRGIIWLRANRYGELAVLCKDDDLPDTPWQRVVAYRMPGGGQHLSVFNFVALYAMHHVADGHSYESTVGDLLALYTSLGPDAGDGPRAPPPPLARDGLAVCEERLRGALFAVDPTAMPALHSLRGNMWGFNGKGYTHSICLQRGATEVLRRCSKLYSAPPDAVLLALAICAIARAGDDDSVSISLYVPSRDGAGDAGLVGLFADWRTIKVHTHKVISTVVGVVCDLVHALRTRNWAVYNALLNPEAFLVNFQLLDAATSHSRGGFTQLGEALWRGGEHLAQGKRGDQMNWAHRPLSMTIAEQNKETLWLSITVGVDHRPPSWMRRFAKAYRDAFWSLAFDPTHPVHGEFPPGFC